MHGERAFTFAKRHGNNRQGLTHGSSAKRRKPREQCQTSTESARPLLYRNRRCGAACPATSSLKKKLLPSHYTTMHMHGHPKKTKVTFRTTNKCSHFLWGGRPLSTARRECAMYSTSDLVDLGKNESKNTQRPPRSRTRDPTPLLTKSPQLPATYI